MTQQIQKNTKRMKTVEAIDLFCGAGGLTCGLRASGVNVLAGLDADPACSYPYSANNSSQFFCKDIREVTGEFLNGLFSEKTVKLLAGCAPCQTFSTYNRKASQEDKRWWLLLEFGRLVKELRPELITMENVPGLAKQNVFNVFLTNLRSLGYFVSFQIVSCERYGVPQVRRRLVLLASLLGDVQLIPPDEYSAKPKNVYDSIYDLPRIAAGEICPEDVLHQAAALSDLNLKRIRSSKPGGSWKDWPSDLICDCHKRDSGATYSAVYGRMRWKHPSPTITTQFFSYGSGRFGHPEQDRALSLREGAILQGFPLSYEFAPSNGLINRTVIGRLIGNAVPVELGKLIGLSFFKHLQKVMINGE